MEKITYTVSAMAVGMSISFLSMLLNSDRSFHIQVDSPNHSLIPLKKIFNIDDNKISISVTDDMSDNIFWELSDVGKLTSPYLSPKFVNVKGQQLSVGGKTNKPCIALACYQDYQHLQHYDASDPNWPNNRYWSIEEYAKIFELIKQAGYEVITLDNHAISLEDKVYWLNEYLIKNATGSTYPAVDPNIFLTIKIKIPKNKQLIKDLEPTFDEIEKLQGEVKEAETLYNQLIKELSEEAMPVPATNTSVTSTTSATSTNTANTTNTVNIQELTNTG